MKQFIPSSGILMWMCLALFVSGIVPNVDSQTTANYSRCEMVTDLSMESTEIDSHRVSFVFDAACAHGDLKVDFSSFFFVKELAYLAVTNGLQSRTLIDHGRSIGFSSIDLSMLCTAKQCASASTAPAATAVAASTTTGSTNHGSIEIVHKLGQLIEKSEVVIFLSLNGLSDKLDDWVLQKLYEHKRVYWLIADPEKENMQAVQFTTAAAGTQQGGRPNVNYFTLERVGPGSSTALVLKNGIERAFLQITKAHTTQTCDFECIDDVTHQKGVQTTTGECNVAFSVTAAAAADPSGENQRSMQASELQIESIRTELRHPFRISVKTTQDRQTELCINDSEFINDVRKISLFGDSDVLDSAGCVFTRACRVDSWLSSAQRAQKWIKPEQGSDKLCALFNAEEIHACMKPRDNGILFVEIDDEIQRILFVNAAGEVSEELDELVRVDVDQPQIEQLSASGDLYIVFSVTAEASSSIGIDSIVEIADKHAGTNVGLSLGSVYSQAGNGRAQAFVEFETHGCVGVNEFQLHKTLRLNFRCFSGRKSSVDVSVDVRARRVNDHYAQLLFEPHMTTFVDEARTVPFSAPAAQTPGASKSTMYATLAWNQMDSHELQVRSIEICLPTGGGSEQAGDLSRSVLVNKCLSRHSDQDVRKTLVYTHGHSEIDLGLFEFHATETPSATDDKSSGRLNMKMQWDMDPRSDYVLLVEWKVVSPSGSDSGMITMPLTDHFASVDALRSRGQSARADLIASVIESQFFHWDTYPFNYGLYSYDAPSQDSLLAKLYGAGSLGNGRKNSASEQAPVPLAKLEFRTSHFVFGSQPSSVSFDVAPLTQQIQTGLGSKIVNLVRDMGPHGQNLYPDPLGDNDRDSENNQRFSGDGDDDEDYARPDPKSRNDQRGSSSNSNDNDDDDDENVDEEILSGLRSVIELGSLLDLDDGRDSRRSHHNKKHSAREDDDSKHSRKHHRRHHKDDNHGKHSDLDGPYGDHDGETRKCEKGDRKCHQSHGDESPSSSSSRGHNGSGPFWRRNKVFSVLFVLVLVVIFFFVVCCLFCVLRVWCAGAYGPLRTPETLEADRPQTIQEQENERLKRRNAALRSVNGPGAFTPRPLQQQ